ncbi:MAG: pyridoxamine 5'-phosphate oxidase family protein [Ruminiclostridium sp.]|nr:pyridoxamine 5'-phosphate oxidase family protein [Ruminiclostridium sp.]
MRRSDREITDPNEIFDILRRCEVCHLALGGEYPYVLPLNFGFCHENGVLTLYFHGASEGEKLDRIRRDPRAGFALETNVRLRVSEAPCGCTAGFESVIGFGKASVVTDPEEREKGLTLLLRHCGHEGNLDFDPRVLDKTTVFKLTAERFTAKRHE